MLAENISHGLLLRKVNTNAAFTKGSDLVSNIACDSTPCLPTQSEVSSTFSIYSFNVLIQVT